MNLFKPVIKDWQTWGAVYQSIEAFEPLIQIIWQKHGWQMDNIEHTISGTNAVFRIKDKIIKIFAPVESGCDTTRDYRMELFGLNYALNKVPTTKVLAQGTLKDRYVFNYIVLSVIEAQPFSLVIEKLDKNRKIKVGQHLRTMCNHLNLPDISMEALDIISRAKLNERWLQFPTSFQVELQEYLYHYRLSSLVYVHGDLNSDNILINDEDELFIIDFADAVLAPIEYEWALIISELFVFDMDYLRGFFNELNIEDYIDICMKGLLIHDYGADIIRDRLGNIDKIKDLQTLRLGFKKVLEQKSNQSSQ